jgi:hypothetical protein
MNRFFQTVLFLGARIDMFQKLHLKFLHKAQWKLLTRSDLPPQPPQATPKNTLASFTSPRPNTDYFQLSYSNNNAKNSASILHTPENNGNNNHLSDVGNRKKCIDMIHILAGTVRAGDKPVKIFVFTIDYAFFWKFGSYVIAGLLAGSKYLYNIASARS